MKFLINCFCTDLGFTRALPYYHIIHGNIKTKLCYQAESLIKHG